MKAITRHLITIGCAEVDAYIPIMDKIPPFKSTVSIRCLSITRDFNYFLRIWTRFS